ncbi:MAG TPA: hypothetical protein VFJ94_01890 [Intrasporangium sp.]|uniref:hypothetical protein n=1 Tax=Intrasporangium sp. TaxID=1925024 RepID=UPI002D79243D|nr:hypothetical protein [Intrasporangium sp.]HET7397246.1 hypothetical protein [Intrasporangium sp.]
MSDLQCAARLLLVPPFEASNGGALAGSFRLERVAAVYAAAGDLEAARQLATRLQVRARQTSGALEPGDDALTELADRHRGESVVVVSGGVVSPCVVLVDGDGWNVAPLSLGADRADQPS